MEIFKTSRNFFAVMAAIMLAIGLVSLIGCSDDDNPSSSESSLLGIDWTLQYTDASNGLYAVAWGGGKFVAVGSSDSALVSSDGKTWSIYEIGDVSILGDIIYGGGQFVAVGDNGQIFTSTDGMNWVERVSGTDNALSAITWTGDLYCAVGITGIVLTSDDGISWDEIETNLQVYVILDIIWAEGRFVASTFLPLGMLTSPDGAEWTDQFPEIEVNYNVLVYGDKYVALGGGGNVAISDDAETWAIARQIYNFDQIYDCIWTGSMYVAVGEGETSIFTSTNGQVWTGRYAGGNHHMNDVAWSPSLKRLVAVGAEGYIMLSE